jgi:hypothetical protein
MNQPLNFLYVQIIGTVLYSIDSLLSRDRIFSLFGIKIHFPPRGIFLGFEAQYNSRGHRQSDESYS